MKWTEVVAVDEMTSAIFPDWISELRLAQDATQHVPHFALRGLNAQSGCVGSQSGRRS